jgi:hypothetical protein
MWTGNALHDRATSRNSQYLFEQVGESVKFLLPNDGLEGRVINGLSRDDVEDDDVEDDDVEDDDVEYADEYEDAS